MQLPNYTQISNEFIEAMHRYDPSVTTVFVAISRKTIGWHKTSDRISISQLEKITGLTKNTIKKAISILQKDGWITQTKTKYGYVYDLNIDAGVSKDDTGGSDDDPGGSMVDPVEGSINDPTKETNKETNIKQNNSDVAVDFQSIKGSNIVFTWPEVQKLSSDSGISKEEVVETLNAALKKADTAGKVKNIKGWAISAVKSGWNLDAKENPGDAEAEYQESKERNEREARRVNNDLRKAVINNECSEAQAFFKMKDKIVSKPDIDQIVQNEDNERRSELHKQRVEVLKKELVPA